MNIDDLTLREIKELTKVVSGGCDSIPERPFSVGKNYFIRTVTMYYTGRLVKIYAEFIELDECAWIPDTGRFQDFLLKGNANEVEPFINKVVIPLSSLIDMTEWRNELPKKQK